VLLYRDGGNGGQISSSERKNQGDGTGAVQVAVAMGPTMTRGLNLAASVLSSVSGDHFGHHSHLLGEHLVGVA